MANPLEFAGEEAFRAPVGRVRATLGDLKQVVGLLPHVDSVERITDSAGELVRGIVRPGFSFLRGKLTVTIRRADPPDAPADELQLLVNSKGIGVSIDVAARLTFVPAGDGAAASGTVVHWTAAVTHLSGLVAAVSKPLIHAAAQQVIQQSWDQIRAAVDES